MCRGPAKPPSYEKKNNNADARIRTEFPVNESGTKFSPPVWATIGLVVACGLFVRAGFWQLDRGVQKRELFSAFDNSLNTGTLNGLVTDFAGESFRYRRIEIAGAYDSEHQILLDNMMHKGRPGYHVLTPLLTSSLTVLVNRGWVPADRDRSVLPGLSVMEEERRITGRLDYLPRAGIKIEPPAPNADAPWPRRRLFPSVTEIEEMLGQPLLTYQLLLDDGADDGFIREWRPAVMGPERHVGYAVQWFGLALTLVIIYVVVNLKKAKQD